MIGLTFAIGLMSSAAVADCRALGAYRQGAVAVQRATALEPRPIWQLTGAAGSYQPAPVAVPFCRVEGTIEGNIGFELWLPQRWNGRLLGAGVGGDAGVFNYRDMTMRIHQGFATVTTDSGHKASQAHWMLDAKALADYEHRAVHLTAASAKALVARFYGRSADRSYFLGCSGGGRQALKEMQNYPGDYDGVVAGAAAPYMPLVSVRPMWVALQQKWNPAAALSDADWTLYEAAVTKACDRNDGLADGIIENPLTCRFDKRALLCAAGQTSGCLSAPKVAMLESITEPLLDENGRRIDDGLLPGVRTRPGPPSPLLRAMWADAVHHDPDWNEDTFRRRADAEAAYRAMPELRADRTDITPFVGRGGKAILYQGWADPSTNAGPMLDYYAALARANGGPEKVAHSVRLYMAPGMYHCRGGPGADAFGGSGHPLSPDQPEPKRDILWALIRWVEAGEAPEELTAAKLDDKAGVRFTRRLCPFPKVAAYDGKGDPNRAESANCRVEPSYLARLAAERQAE